MPKPALARGMRDFLPDEAANRHWMFSTLAQVFEQYGFARLETPAIENLEVLTEKYGEEGDRLLFKILENGEYLKDVDEADLLAKNHSAIGKKITTKGLRYDLTVPLARYVAMHRSSLPSPFKRFQIDKVWRADRPQKGRYREFYQCDADVLGTTSLLSDAELVLLLDAGFTALGIDGTVIKINNRKILAGLAEAFGFADRLIAFTVALDKLDKIGEHGVVAELGNRGFAESEIRNVQEVLRHSGDNDSKLDKMRIYNSPLLHKGIEELREVLGYCTGALNSAKVEVDFTLARGLDYYTGTIYEAMKPESGLGSIASGGRYDNLTVTFGLPDMPGVGISFGAERLYDILKAEGRFENASMHISPEVMGVNFGPKEVTYALSILQKLRGAGIRADLYPQAHKLGRQLQYAEKRGITFAMIAGYEEKDLGMVKLKNLKTGEQLTLSAEELESHLKNHRLA